MDDRTAGTARLRALAEGLEPQGYETELVNGQLLVAEPGPPEVTVTVLCRPRASDAGRLWFLHHDHEPIVEADQMMNAVTAIKGRLAEARALMERRAAAAAEGREPL